MTYLIVQIFVCLLIAFLLGLFLGLLLCKLCKAKKEGRCCSPRVEPSVAAAPVVSAVIDLDTPVNLDAEGYGVETLEGVGPQTGDLFRGYGISTVGDYLKKLYAPTLREKAAVDLGIRVVPLHGWAYMSDLLRVEGVNHQHSELLHASGIQTVGALGESNASDLLVHMQEVNSAGKQLISPTVPAVDDLGVWIARARSMKPVVTV